MSFIEPPEASRYCRSCGAPLAADADRCPACGVPWRLVTVPEDAPSLVALLNTAAEWRRDGLLDEASAARVRDYLEARLTAIVESVPPRPPVKSGPAASELLATWAAERQADILLYLGAFLLVISAVVFVAYQGETLGSSVRVVLLATYTIGFVVAGMVVRRWSVVREAGRVFLALGALITPLNFVLLHVEVLSERGVSGDLIWFLGSVYATAFYGALGARGFGTLYAWLGAGARISAWAALASVLGIPAEWLPAWFMALAAATATLLGVLGRLTLPALWGLGITAALATLGALGAAAGSDQHEWQLSVTFALLGGGLAAAGWARREPLALPAAATAALAAVLAALWAAEVPRAWSVYPVLTLGVAAVATRLWWSGWSAGLARGGWAYATAAAVGAALIVPPGEPSWHAVAAFLAGAAILAAIAWLDRRLGMITVSLEDDTTATIERIFFGWASFGMLLGGIARANQRLGIQESDTGWAFLALTLAVVLALAVLARREGRWEFRLLPLVVAATVAGLQRADLYPGREAVLLGVPALALVGASAYAHRWVSLVIAALLGAAAALAAWHALAWPLWSLAVTYSAAGSVTFAALTRRRRYEVRSEAETAAIVSIVVLSWAGAVAGPATAAAAVQRMTDAGALSAVSLVEYRVLVALVLAVAPLLAFEGWRLREAGAFVAASATVLVAALMAIAIAEPENVQAYTLPTSVYLIVLGIVVRRSPPVWGRHAYLHEVVQLAGAAVLVFPQAEQSFEPGGAWWGFVLLAEGVFFLAAAFLLAARWMAVVGIVTLSGVALRWLAESGDTVPYWVTLGIAGLFLLLLGVILLLRHDWWDGVRLRTSRWWQNAAG